MSRKHLIAGNWKMYKTPAESRATADALLHLCKSNDRDDIVVCPTSLSLSIVLDALSGTNIGVGAQNMHFADERAYTGEISAPMLTSIGVQYVIIGHSERRQYFNETDETVNLKLHAALRHGLKPIVCVGEVLAEREGGLTEEVLTRQIDIALRNIAPDHSADLIVAYEPVWAIGTGITATPQQAQDAHAIIRREIAAVLGPQRAAATRILYGGSVKPENAASLMAQPDIDGALVGGASLDPETFCRIVNYKIVA